MPIVLYGSIFVITGSSLLLIVTIRSPTHPKSNLLSLGGMIVLGIGMLSAAITPPGTINTVTQVLLYSGALWLIASDFWIWFTQRRHANDRSNL
jgi:hypothetical protein